MNTTAAKLADLRQRMELAQEPAGPKAVAKRARKGIPSARERIHMLFDPGTFIEIGALVKQPNTPDALYGDGVVTGHGLVEGRPVAVFSHDQTVFGGSVGEMFGRKVSAVLELAAKVGIPVVGINDSGGARIQDAVTSLAWYAEMSRRHEPLLGVVPQVSMILGKCAGGAVYAPVTGTETLVATKDSYMFVTGPQVIKDVMGEDVTLDDLGGADNQLQNGNLQHVAEDEKAAFAWVRHHLSYFPTSAYELPPVVNPGLEPDITESDLRLNGFMPDNDNAGYDMHDLLLHLFDDGDFHEIAAQYAPNLITGYTRIDGRTVGVIANQPLVLSGSIDARASDKASRFIRICNAFEIPIVFVVDTPGVMPGIEEEKVGVIRRGGRFFYSVVEASVPIVTLIVRKAYGGAYAVMGCKQLGADINLAWPTARIAVMGAESAVSILFRKAVEDAGENGPTVRKQMIDYYNATVPSPWVAAERGYIDAVIEPSTTRLELRKALRLLRDKRVSRMPRKHHIMPI